MEDHAEVQNISTYDKSSKPWPTYILQYVETPIFCLLGIAGNSLSIVVFQNPLLKKSTFHQTLISLAVCDLLFLGFILIDFGQDILYPIYIIMFPHFIRVFSGILCIQYFPFDIFVSFDLV